MAGTCCRGEWPDWLAVTSDKGTLHVFSLRRGMGQGGVARTVGGGGGVASSSNGTAAAAAAPAGADDTSPTRANPTSALSFVSVSLGSCLGACGVARTVSSLLPLGSAVWFGWWM